MIIHAHLSVTAQFQPEHLTQDDLNTPDKRQLVDTHRRHSAHETGTRPGRRRCFGGSVTVRDFSVGVGGIELTSDQERWRVAQGIQK